MLTSLPKSDARVELFITLLLCGPMWLTRSHHFASTIALPDASWAMFFLAGTLTRRWFAPAALMTNAGIIDYIALLGGVSDYCVTPAYPFLLPTYLTLWAAGRWASYVQYGSLRSMWRICLALVLGVTGAFLISNASFYLLAGYFDNMTPLEYSRRVLRYLPGFFEGTALYSGIALGIVSAWHAAPTLRASSSGPQPQ